MTFTHTRRLAAGLYALLCIGSAAAQPAIAGGEPVVLLSQDWTNIGLITADNTWNSVPGIVGYRGDGMASGTGADPRTILADGSGTPVSVIANQTNPDTLATGGIAEFHLANPVVAFQGSGTAKAPHLVLTVNTTGLTDINVSYLLRDIDGSGDNAVQPVALHYRVGTSGNYTNVPAGFVPDASTGPNVATLVTPVNVTLPAAANDRPVVQIRIMTTDAPASDEWIGIDDIRVTGVAPASNTPPVVDAGGPYTVDRAGMIALDGTAEDADGDPLTISWTVAPEGPTFSDPNEIDPELTGNNAPAGEYVLTLTVDDGSGPVSDTTLLTVTADEPPVRHDVYITEWMYDGAGGEFVELTNTGSVPVDVTGWSYDDDSAIPGVFDLGGFGVIQPGESVLFVESDPEAFRAVWNLCSGLKIVGPYTNNLGRADQINIFDADGVLVDRLTYGDVAFPGSIRTQNASGWVTAAGLGLDDVYAWTLSSVGDAEASILSNGGAVGSPGRSGRATVPYEPCTAVPPSVSLADAIVAGSVGDAQNPGTVLTVADDDTDPAELIVTVTTSNAAVITPAGVTVTGDGAQRQVRFAPNGRGVSTVTFTVADPEGESRSATLQYAASAQAPDASGRYHHRVSDASAALDFGDGYMILLNDETNTIFLHRADQTGLPVKTWTFTADQLGTGSEIDFEGIARLGDRVLLTGSHGNNRSGAARPERRTLVAATITGSGGETELAFHGRHNDLWAELRAWDQSNGHGLGADALGFVAAMAPGVLPNPPAGFNIEGLEFSPDGEAVYLGFRAPTIQVDGSYRALIVPLLNVEALVDGSVGGTAAQFGAPMLFDLAGRSIRAMASNVEGDFLISAGPSPQNDTWALYTWNGDPSTPPQFNRELPAEDPLTGGTWESIGAVPHPLVEGAMVRLVTDSGDTNFYGTGATKDLASPYQKSYSQLFTLAEVPGGGDAGGIRITEWMYGGVGGEFVELTNTGSTAVDLAGWSYDDDSAIPGEFSLSGFGVVEPGESVVFVETDPEAFRSEWNLCRGVKIIGPYTNNLGRADQINIFDADGVLVDRLTYGDVAFPGSIRTQDVSGWVSAEGLGVDDVYEWSLSAVGDGEGSVQASGGAIGSPGRSTRATVPFEPCQPVVEHLLVVSIEAAGTGSVTGEGIDCPADCEQRYVEGTDVSLTASPTAGFVFAGWTGDCAGTGTCAVTMDAAKSVGASFIAAASIAIEPQSLSATLVTGTSAVQTLTIANAGAKPLSWHVNENASCALPSWLDVDPRKGTVAGGDSQAVAVDLSAIALAPGAYTASLCISSNDAATPQVIVPLALTVTAVPAPVLAFDPVSVDFGAVEIGSSSAVVSVSLQNSGNADATGLEFGAVGAGFAVDAGNCGAVLAAGAACELGVSFAPAAAGTATAALTATSAAGATATLALSGTGVLPADPQTDVVVSIDPMQLHVQPGALVDYLVVVGNAGPDAAIGVSVASVLSSMLDTDLAEWMCVEPAGSGCTASGTGNLVDAALTLAAGAEVIYVISAPARMEADGEIVTAVTAQHGFDVNPANNAGEASVDVVIYRDGFEPESGITPLPLAPFQGPVGVGEAIVFDWPAAASPVIDTLLVASPAGAGLEAEAFRLERLAIAGSSWARVVGRDELSGEYASAWLRAAAGETLQLVILDTTPGQDSHGGAVLGRTAWLLTGAGARLVPLVSQSADYRLWTAVPLSVEPAPSGR